MRIVQYHDIVIGEAIVGANIFRDYFAKIRDIVGGRSAAYEKAMNQARRLAFNDLMETAASLGANAVIGIDLNCGVIDKRGSMFVGNIDHWHRDQRRRRTRPQRIPATVNGRFPAPSTTLQADTPSRAPSRRHRPGTEQEEPAPLQKASTKWRTTATARRPGHAAHRVERYLRPDRPRRAQRSG